MKLSVLLGIVIIFLHVLLGIAALIFATFVAGMAIVFVIAPAIGWLAKIVAEI